MSLNPSERNATFQLKRALKAEDECRALLDALERKDRVIRSIKQEAETALVIGDEIGMRDGLVQILKEADQEFGITTRN